MSSTTEPVPDTNGSSTTSTSASTTNMTSTKITINPQRASDLSSALSSILKVITTTHSSLPNPNRTTPRLVAVSKLKPASDILTLHSPPTTHLHFGENYVQELLEKSRLLPRSIRWHMIGGLQSNKCRELARDVPNLWAVESVDSVKKAGLLEKGRAEMVERWREREEMKMNGNDVEGENGEGEAEEKDVNGNGEDDISEDIIKEPLRVYVQVNTSGEDSKSGVSPSPTSPELLELCQHIITQCPHLHLQGLMTIGAIARSQASTPETVNEDFVCLRDTRDRLATELGVEKDTLELSMGMSEDFEAAIAQGSGEVRVGSTIFGVRPSKKDARVV